MEFKANEYSSGEIMKFMRESKDITQVELANRMGKSKNWVKSNEQGITRYYLSDFLKMANLLDIEIIIKEKKKKS